MRFQGQKAGAEQGRWFVYMREGDEKVEFRVRGVPAGEERRMDFEINQRKRPVALKKGKLIIDVEKQLKLSVAKACYALLDSRNADFPVPSEDDQLQVFRDGFAPETKAGDTVRLDGKWSDSIKAVVLGSPEAGRLVRWIIEKADQLEVGPDEDDEEDEPALGKT
jgi:hypothetical protein